jgi:hypothetical protein
LAVHSREFAAVTFDLGSILTAASLLGGLSVGGCAVQGSQSAASPDTPGWTGSTVVSGNNSTIAGNASATELQQKWPLGRNR